MNISIYHFKREDNIIVTVYTDDETDFDAIQTKVISKHGNVTFIENNKNVIPDWTNIQRGYKKGKITNVDLKVKIQGYTNAVGSY
jgi:hypothetical protein